MRLRILMVLGWLIGGAGSVVAQQGNDPIVVSDLLKIQQLSNVTVSPDGRHVVYTVRSIVEDPDEAGDYSYRTHLHLVSMDGSRPARSLTQGDRSASQPAWHPDSERLAFVRSVKGTSQIFVLSLLGGEPYQMTDVAYGASLPRWSPDGSTLLFAASLSAEEVKDMTGEQPAWPEERPLRSWDDTDGAEPNPDGSLAEIRAWLAENRNGNNPRVFNRLNLQGELDLAPQRTYRHLFVMDDIPLAEPRAITQGYYSFSSGVWLPDGHQVIVSGAPIDHTHPDRVRESDLFVVDVTDGGRSLFLDIEGYSVTNPIVHPSGSMIAFSARDQNDPGYAQTELGIFAIHGRSAPELLTLGFDRSLSNPKWSKEGWFLYMTAPTDGGFPLYRMTVDDALAPVDSQAVSQSTFAAEQIQINNLDIDRLTGLERGVRSYDVSDASVFYVLTEVANPFELYTNTTGFATEQRLTDHHATWLSSKRLSLPEAHTLRREEYTIPYWIMPPTVREEGQTYPLLLEIHGGPSSMWGPGEATMWHEFQYFAARGYGIVYSNPRGSGGYGHAFKQANYQDWGVGPAGDVLATVDAAIRERWVDPNRLVVTGGSYAGYLTAWIVSQDHRFKAAAAQRGVYDLGTFMGEGNAWRLVPNHFGGYPWEDEVPDSVANNEGAVGQSIRDILFANSPLTFVNDIQTPLLIMHGDNDLRTGVIQSEILYKSLKILNRPVEYIRYPQAGHDLSRSGNPRQRMDRILRIHEFLGRYVE